MEIIEFLQLVLLLGLLAAVTVLLVSLGATRRFDDKRDKDEESRRNQLRLAPNRAVHRPRNDLSRELDRRLASG
ncbi:MAG: hypothetical protein OXI52_06945 [Caldilineaceae bacterium]|nr:hypothetical protein [Caldilineaceae bacterium]MCY3990156.1 hypothetical protein [Caldilineaceae bacterium]MDE0311986.1 hypothetical protein [Caldilineaceae bacterium]